MHVVVTSCIAHHVQSPPVHPRKLFFISRKRPIVSTSCPAAVPAALTTAGSFKRMKTLCLSSSARVNLPVVEVSLSQKSTRDLMEGLEGSTEAPKATLDLVYLRSLRYQYCTRRAAED